MVYNCDKMIWERPPIYMIIHVLSGFAAYSYPILLFAIIGYHFLQYFLNVRFFVFEMTYKEGNSLEHTALKLFEVAVGYFLAGAWHQTQLDVAEIGDHVANH